MKFKPEGDETQLTLATQRLCADTSAAVAEFFGLAEATMLSDRGWNFCRFGQQFERAVITCNAGATVFKSLAKRAAKFSDGEDHPVEIELSAFLRMLASRDAYHRLYQMRAEPLPVLRMLYLNGEVPRSVRKCLGECARLLSGQEHESPGSIRSVETIDRVVRLIENSDWEEFFPGASLPASSLDGLVSLLGEISDLTHKIHGVVTDGFINHQLAD